MTLEEIKMVHLLTRTVIDAVDWRETFEINAKDGEVASFEDIGLGETFPIDSRIGFNGALVMPRDLAIEMMAWLERRARERLREAGVPQA